MTLGELRQRPDLRDSVKTSAQYKAAYLIKSKEHAKKRTVELMRARLDKRQRLYDEDMNGRRANQSLGALKSEGDADSFENFESTNTVSPLGNHSDVIYTPTATETNLSLDNFFQRPILIKTISLSSSNVNPPLSFDPFTLWSSDPSVRAKLLNYAFFKGDLEVVFSISSTKFQFGNYIVSNQPFASSNLTLQAILNGLTILTPQMTINYLSQSPERINLVIGRDTSVTMKIPFILPKPVCRLFNSDGTVITNAVPYEELTESSLLHFFPVNDMRDASGTQSLAKIQVYARVVNIQLGPPTASPMDIVAEGKKEDEYSSNGPISSVATAVSKAANTLSSVPVIGKIMRATSIASGAVARIAGLFGYSKPANVENISIFKNVPYQNGAVTEGRDTTYKLSLDPKQELGIVSLGGDSDADPMAFRTITSRETLFHTFLWSRLDLGLSDTLAVYPVCPMLYTKSIQGPSFNTVLQPTTLAFVAEQFQHWRGTIRFRFEIVASSFHKGKLMFIYEPNIPAQGLIQADTTDLNRQYVQVVDIEEQRDVVIDVGFVYDRLFAKCFPTSDPGIFKANLFDYCNYNDGDAVSDLFDYAIGTLTVRPFNQLVTLNTVVNTVSVNVYASSPDIEFANPGNKFVYNRALEPDAGRPAVTFDLKPEGGEPYATEAVAFPQTDSKSGTVVAPPPFLINKMQPDIGDSFLYHFGERVVSFRSLLKRYMTTAYLKPSISADFIGINLPFYPATTEEAIPAFPAIPNNGEDFAGDYAVATNLFNYLRYAYLFVRGGYRYQITCTNPDGKLPHINVLRNMSAAINDTQQPLPFGLAKLTNLDSGGGVMFNTNTNFGVEFEVPYYSNNLFERSQISYKQLVDTNYPLFIEGPQPPTLTVENHTSPSTKAFLVNSAAAEDFSFLRFQGTPFYTIPLG